MPTIFKNIARIPIPKPNAPNEYRPISLCHDLYCFVNGIIAELSSKALEDAGIIPEGLAAYIKGRGCSMLVATELGLREDCIESNIPACRLDEDEEKFFDRICLELILAVLRINGFPIKGYIELKASCMWNKQVEIITNRGSVFSEFKCGLEQGNPDSPKMANLIIMLKHLVWSNLTKKLQNEYKMFSVDSSDGIVKISATGFSDDNTQNSANECVEQLIRDLQKYIKLSGDLSMVLKIGRKGSKCVIYLYNIPAEKVLDIPIFETVAWSYKDDRPTKEIIPVKIYLQSSEMDKLQTLLLDPALKDKVENLLNKKDNKHLGLYMDLDGDTSESTKKTLECAKTRLREIKLYNLNVIPMQISANMLITTMHSFAPIQKNHDINDLIQCDQLLMNSVKTACGYSKSDAKHLLFMTEENGGFGLKSFQECDLKANVRELEVVLNGEEYDSKILRSRVTAIRNRLSAYLGSKNHVNDAIIKLSKYGIYLRDQEDGLLNRILDNIAISLNRMPVGDPNYDGGTGALLGPGVLNLTQTALGGTWYTAIRNFFFGIWSEEQVKYILGENGFDLFQTCTAIAKKQETIDKAAMTSYLEWTINKNPYKYNDPKNLVNWREICLDENRFIHKHNNGQSEWKFKETWKLAEKTIRINPLTCIKWDDIRPKPLDNLGEAILTVHNSQSPFLIATDGGHLDSSQSPNLTTASITICMLDIKERESLESGEWMNRQVIPLIMRSCVLPNQIGVNHSDCNHGEAMAFCLQEECLPPEICRAVIMDSASVRSRVLELRQDDKIRHRKKVRCIYPGIGKGLMSRINFGINKWKTADNINSLIPDIAPENYGSFCRDLNRRHGKLINILNDFANNTADINQLWKIQYRDNNTVKSIWKIDSHQLDTDGHNMRKAPSRHPILTPNLALLNANHWADLGATLAMKWMGNNKLQYIKNRDIRYTTNEFRFFFTWKGNMIDKNTCLFLDRILEMERLKRWQSKEAHGMLGRIFPVSTLLPRDIPYKSGLRRFLLYLTNTHTRSTYKCIDYKNAATLYIANKLLAEDKNIVLDTDYLNTFNIEDQLLHRCTWCDLHWNDFHQRKGYEFKGNRRHMILFCNNNKISSFRKFMRHIIEDALVELHRLISKEIGKMNENSWLVKVQDTLLLLQKNNIGKLIKKGKVKNTTQQNYWSIQQWLQKLNLCCIEEGILSEKDILSHIFGLRHSLEDGNLPEKNCGAVDCIVYGVIPKALHDCILDCFRTSTKHIQNNRTRNDTILKLQSKWKSIIKLIRLQVVGIHRICNTQAKDFKKEWMNRFNLLSEKKKRIERDSLIDLELREEESIDNESCLSCNSQQDKVCDGIRCKYANQVWASAKKIRKKRIRIDEKTCQECKKLNLALRKAIKIGKWLIKDNKVLIEEIKQRKIFLKTMCETTKLYIIGDILEKYLMDRFGCLPVQLKGKNGKITDSTRLILRYLGQVLGFQTLPIFNVTFIRQEKRSVHNNTTTCTDWTTTRWNTLATNLQSWQKIIDNKIILVNKRDKRSAASTGTVKSIECSPFESSKHVHQWNGNEITIQKDSNNPAVIPKKEDPTIRVLEKVNRGKRIKKLHKANGHQRAIENITSVGNLLSSDYVDLVLDQYRADCATNIYIAGAYTTSLIRLEENTNNWRTFGRLFRNNNAIGKMDGAYIIPTFTGSNECGHWLVNAVWWEANQGRGFTLDSLGRGGIEKSLIRNKLKEFFGTNLFTDWDEIQCVRQTENECGPRMLQAIKTLSTEVDSLMEFESLVLDAANLFDIGRRESRNIAVRNKVGGYLRKQPSDT